MSGEARGRVGGGVAFLFDPKQLPSGASVRHTRAR